MTQWTKEKLSGMLVCAVCGVPKLEKEECCKTAPHITFEIFTVRYFPGCHHDPLNDDKEHFVPKMVAEAFYEDYLLSNYDSLEEYIENTQENIEE